MCLWTGICSRYRTSESSAITHTFSYVDRERDAKNGRPGLASIQNHTCAKEERARDRSLLMQNTHTQRRAERARAKTIFVSVRRVAVAVYSPQSWWAHVLGAHAPASRPAHRTRTERTLIALKSISHVIVMLRGFYWFLQIVRFADRSCISLHYVCNSPSLWFVKRY